MRGSNMEGSLFCHVVSWFSYTHENRISFWKCSVYRITIILRISCCNATSSYICKIVYNIVFCRQIALSRQRQCCRSLPCEAADRQFSIWLIFVKSQNAPPLFQHTADSYITVVNHYAVTLTMLFACGYMFVLLMLYKVFVCLFGCQCAFNANKKILYFLGCFLKVFIMLFFYRRKSR